MNPEDKRIQINIIPGIGENLVSGKEVAFSINNTGNGYVYSDEDEVYHGQIFIDALTAISKTGTEIKREVTPYLNSLINGTKALLKLKKHPLDIEFTIAHNSIYWLQVRPITTTEIEEISIWDNTHSESNYPEITMPLSISLVQASIYYAYTGMGRFLGMNKKSLLLNETLLKNMCGEIHGGLYYHVTAWQKLIYQLPLGKKASKLLPKMWGMESADFSPNRNKISGFIRIKILFKFFYSFLVLNKLKKKYLDNFEMVTNEYKAIDFNKKTHSELVAMYSDIQSRLGSNWAAPGLNGFFAMLLFSALKKVTSSSRLSTKYPNFVNDVLFAQGDVISVTIVRTFQKLLYKIQEDPQLLELFNTHSEEEIEQTLSEKHPEFKREIKEYIELYGDRSEEGELKMETVNFKENPLLFIAFLKQNSTGKTNAPFSETKFDYKAILKKEYPFNIVKRVILKHLITNTMSMIRDRENYRFIRTRTFGLVRSIFRAIDADLLKSKCIEVKNDSLYLVLEELSDVQLNKSYADIISKRKAENETHKTTRRVNRYVKTKHGFEPVELSETQTDSSTISGTGCCSGMVKAQVKIIDNNTDTNENFTGKILVADYFEPGKINLFSQAAGIISIRGNLLSHTAILCREMGIPSIVGAKGLLSKIKDGSRIEMNGSTGKIYVIEDND